MFQIATRSILLWCTKKLQEVEIELNYIPEIELHTIPVIELHTNDRLT